jgi:hypothetical protein
MEQGIEPYRAWFYCFSKLANSVLSDLGAMSVKVTFLFMLVRVTYVTFNGEIKEP